MIKDWIIALRLRTLPLAFACIGMGGILAYIEKIFQWDIFLHTLLTAFLLQISSNLANDYGDAIHGADSVDRLGPKRAVQSGKISAKAMKNATIFSVLISFFLGATLIYISISSWREFFIFLAMGLLCILAAITYTAGKKPYGYAGLGDISVLIFFGLVAVLGTYYLQAGYLDKMVILPAVTCGIFAVGVLNINNIRDITSDKKAGKYSIPVRIGRQKAVYYHWLLLGLGWLAMLIYVSMLESAAWKWLFVITLPLFVINARAVQTKKDPKALDPYLKQMAFSTLLFVLLFGCGVYLDKL